MKSILVSIFLLVSTLSFGQKFYAYGNLSSRTVGSGLERNITITLFNGGYKPYPDANYATTDIATGMVVWINCTRFPIKTIVSTSPLVLTVADSMGTGGLDGLDLYGYRLAILEESRVGAYNIAAFPDIADGNAGTAAGLSPKDGACIQNYYGGQLDLAITNVSVTASNGLTESLDTIRLGGDLTANTTVSSGTNSLTLRNRLTTSGANYRAHLGLTSTKIGLYTSSNDDENSAYIETTANGGLTMFTDDITPGQSIQFDFGISTGAKLSDSRTTPLGFTYDAFYGNTIRVNPQSIPDVQTVELMIDSLAGVSVGDKGEIDVVSSTDWRIDTSAVTWVDLAQAVKDSINAGGSGSGLGNCIAQTVNKSSHGFTLGQGVAWRGGTIVGAGINALIPAEAVVTEVVTSNQVVISYSGECTATSHGFTVDSTYYTPRLAGAPIINASRPDTIQFLFRPSTANKLVVNIGEMFVEGGSSGGGSSNGMQTVQTITSTSAPTVTSGYSIIPIKASSASASVDVQINPATTGVSYQIVATDVTNTLRVVPSSGTISGLSAYTFSVATESISVISDGTNLYIW